MRTDSRRELKPNRFSHTLVLKSGRGHRDRPWQGFQLLGNQAPRTSQLSLLELDAIRVENTNRGVTQVNIQADEIHLGLLSVRLAGSSNNQLSYLRRLPS